MALTPLQVEILDAAGVPVDGATIELRHELTGVATDGYNRNGTVMTPPILTGDDGGAVTWLPNGIYEWRTSDPVVSNWRPFPAYRGFGYEDVLEETPAAATPIEVDFVNAGGGIDDLVGTIEVELDFEHDHLGNVVVLLVAPYDLVRVPTGPPVAATDGVDPLVGAEVEVRNAITGSAATVTDSGGTPLGTPYLTDSNGGFVGYLPPSVYEWRVPTSANIPTWTAAPARSESPTTLWNGPENVRVSSMADFAFDGVVTFANDGGDSTAAFADGDRLNVISSTALNRPSVGTWKLYIAGAGTGTLRAATLRFVPV